MLPSTVPAALVGKAAAAVAGLAYLNARFSIGQDLNFLLGRRAAFAALTKTGEDFTRDSWSQIEIPRPELPDSHLKDLANLI